jgi:hypothetical protein
VAQVAVCSQINTKHINTLCEAKRGICLSLSRVACEISTGFVDCLCVLDEKRDSETSGQKIIRISVNMKKYKEVLDKLHKILLTNKLFV